MTTLPTAQKIAENNKNTLERKSTTNQIHFFVDTKPLS